MLIAKEACRYEIQEQGEDQCADNNISKEVLQITVWLCLVPTNETLIFKLKINLQ